MSRNEPLAPQRVAIYARQSVAEEQGIKQQITACRAEAKHKKWVTDPEFVYEDDGTSGSKERGPGTEWAKMLNDFDKGLFDSVLVTDIDRLTRSLTDVLELSLPKRAIRVLSIRGAVDSHDSSGDFLLKLLVILAEREVKQKAQRAKVYAVARHEVGHPAAGKAPHGYTWMSKKDRDDEGTRYEINEDEAQDVRFIYREFLTGASLGQIARDLNTDDRKTRTGKRWVTSTIRRILMNPMYAAMLPPTQESGKHDLAAISLEQCTDGAWKAIVEPDYVKATRARLVGVKPNHNGTTPKWLLSGIAVCSVCQKPVRSARGETKPRERVDGSGSAPRKRYHAYRCVAGHFMRNGDIVDDFVSELCIGYISEPEHIELLTRPKVGPDLGVLHMLRGAQHDRESAIALMIARGTMSPKAAEQALDEIAAEMRDLDAQIASAVRVTPFADLVGVKDVRAWWADATLARRQGIVKMLMTVEIRPVGYGRRVTTMERASETVGIIWKGAPEL